MIQIETNTLVEALIQLQRRYPNWRFGQLVCNIAGWADKNVWDIEDEEWLAAAQAHLDRIAARDNPLHPEIM